MSEPYYFTPTTDAAIDERLGLVTLKIPYVVSPQADWASTLRLACTIRPPEVDALGLALVKRDVKQRQDGGYDVSFNLDGHFTPDLASGEEFSLDGTTSEDRIETIDNIQALIDKYEGDKKDDDSVVFPLTLDINGETVRNPMHGVKTWYNPGAAWTRTYVAAQLPAGLFFALGAIETPPTGLLGQRPPAVPHLRNWLKIRVKADWRGNIWRIAETWMLSGPGGWNPDMYRYR